MIHPREHYEWIGGGWESQLDRLVHKTRPVVAAWERHTQALLREAVHEVGFVHRNNGASFTHVPWPTAEVMASDIDAAIPSIGAGGNKLYARRAAFGDPRFPQQMRAMRPHSITYQGLDGETLYGEPTYRRRLWSVAQWEAYYEYKAEVAAMYVDREPSSAALEIIVKEIDDP